MSEPRLIRKQSNRRLYDTRTRGHVTLHELGEIISAGESIRVVEARTDQDITRSVLMQILTELDSPATSLLSQSFLENLIRLYSNPLQGIVANYLDASLDEFNRQQAKLTKSWQRTAAKSAGAAWADSAQKGVENWLGMQKELIDLWTGKTPDEDPEKD